MQCPLICFHNRVRIWCIFYVGALLNLRVVCHCIGVFGDTVLDAVDCVRRSGASKTCVPKLELGNE